MCFYDEWASVKHSQQAVNDSLTFTLFCSPASVFQRSTFFLEWIHFSLESRWNPLFFSLPLGACLQCLCCQYQVGSVLLRPRLLHHSSNISFHHPGSIINPPSGSRPGSQMILHRWSTFLLSAGFEAACCHLQRRRRSILSLSLSLLLGKVGRVGGH